MFIRGGLGLGGLIASFGGDSCGGLGMVGGFGGFGNASLGGFGRERAVGGVVVSTSGLTANSGTGMVSTGGEISLGALFEPSIESARAR